MNDPKFWFAIFLMGGGILILDAALSMTSIDADFQSLGVALLVVGIVQFNQSESNSKREKREEEALEILKEIRGSLAKGDTEAPDK